MLTFSSVSVRFFQDCVHNSQIVSSEWGSVNTFASEPVSLKITCGTEFSCSETVLKSSLEYKFLWWCCEVAPSMIHILSFVSITMSLNGHANEHTLKWGIALKSR